MCELAQGCSPLLLPLAARRCCCLELAAAAARRSAAAAEARALGAGAVGVGGCAQLRWSATCMRSVSSALLLAKLRWSATGMRSVSSALLLAKRQQQLEACRCCSLLGFSPRLRPGSQFGRLSLYCLCACDGACTKCASLPLRYCSLSPAVLHPSHSQ